MIIHGLSTDGHRQLRGRRRSSRSSGSRRCSRRCCSSTRTRASSRTRRCATPCRAPSTRRRSQRGLRRQRPPSRPRSTRPGELPDGHGRWTTRQYDPTRAARGSWPGCRTRRSTSPTRPTTPATSATAELIQTELQAAGLNVTVRGHADRPGLRPAEPPGTGAGPPAGDGQPRRRPPRHLGPHLHQHRPGRLNWLQCSVPDADAAMDPGLHATDKADGPGRTTPRPATCSSTRAAGSTSPTSRRWSSPASGLHELRAPAADAVHDPASAT